MHTDQEEGGNVTLPASFRQIFKPRVGGGNANSKNVNMETFFNKMLGLPIADQEALDNVFETKYKVFKDCSPSNEQHEELIDGKCAAPVLASRSQ
jgi:hypothetical protein